MGRRNIWQNFVMFNDFMASFNAAFSDKRTHFSLKIFDYRQSWSFYVIKINIRWKSGAKKINYLFPAEFREYAKNKTEEKKILGPKIRTGMQTFSSTTQHGFENLAIC